MKRSSAWAAKAFEVRLHAPGQALRQGRGRVGPFFQPYAGMMNVAGGGLDMVSREASEPFLGLPAAPISFSPGSRGALIHHLEPVLPRTVYTLFAAGPTS